MGREEREDTDAQAVSGSSPQDRTDAQPLNISRARDVGCGTTGGGDSMNNIYDPVFRTVIEYLPELFLPLINEVFGTDYRMDEAVVPRKNEHFTWGGETVTDMYFEISDRHLLLFMAMCIM